MEPRLILEQSQKLIMTPELKQAITVLTLPALELTDYIQQQLEDNPVLELPDSIEAAPEMPKSEEPNSDLKELFDDRSDLGIGTKMGMDATRKLPGEGFKRAWPPLIQMDAAVKQKMNRLLDKQPC